ncbi:response regulator receiver protein [Caldicellulosiruptor hydrothermalis 108]|uniref:Response regulator receiver protein n=1 Tax=Caldicellulosiruptor hydrothermalis (strain DSM 18901 / VKM B-2411 / 108) TaxID=632292 RepID=E4QD99_CALH1|nr:response regulator [Caldicellulosiruptor hydrothermalis]ADQ06394.1 response regulator receiver protein [Caldicellulosiruptor hydrothermalis 108]
MGQYTVLFVDDEENILHSIKRALMDEEYRCLFANSGNEALQILEKEKVNVIVADMKMPEMDGLTLLKIVKQKYPKVVRVVLSGFTHLPQVLAAINQADIYRFITKPWSIEDELKVAINQALDYYKIQEEREQLTKALEKRNEMYQNLLKTINNKMQEINNSNEILREIINSIISFFIQLCKTQKSIDNLIEVMGNAKNLLSRFILIMPISTVKFSPTRLKKDLEKDLSKPDKMLNSIVINLDSNCRNVIIVSWYGIILFTVEEIIEWIGKNNIVETIKLMVSYNEENKKFVITIPISDSIDENLAMFLIILKFFTSKFEGNIRLDKVNGQNSIIIEFGMKTAEKIVN